MNYKQMMWEHHHYRFGLAGEGQADAIQSLLERRPGRILNAGCGLDGSKITGLASHCEAQIAFDKEEGMVRKGKETCTADNVSFFCGDAYRLPLVGGCVDHVIALGLFAYISEAVLAFREFSRVAKAGGFVIITNSVSRPVDVHKRAGADAGLRLVEETTGYCPAASGDVKQRYMLVFSKN